MMSTYVERMAGGHTIVWIIVCDMTMTMALYVLFISFIVSQRCERCYTLIMSRFLVHVDGFFGWAMVRKTNTPWTLFGVLW